MNIEGSITVNSSKNILITGPTSSGKSRITALVLEKFTEVRHIEKSDLIVQIARKILDDASITKDNFKLFSEDDITRIHLEVDNEIRNILSEGNATYVFDDHICFLVSGMEDWRTAPDSYLYDYNIRLILFLSPDEEWSYNNYLRDKYSKKRERVPLDISRIRRENELIDSVLNHWISLYSVHTLDESNSFTDDRMTNLIRDDVIMLCKFTTVNDSRILDFLHRYLFCLTKGKG